MPDSEERRDKILAEFGKLMAALAVPRSVGMLRGGDRPAWDALHNELAGVGWHTAEQYETALREALDATGPLDRLALGRKVREIWVTAVRELVPDPKPSWTAPWEELDDFQREADCRIGEGLARLRREETRAERAARHAAALAEITDEQWEIIRIERPDLVSRLRKVLAGFAAGGD